MEYVSYSVTEILRAFKNSESTIIYFDWFVYHHQNQLIVDMSKTLVKIDVEKILKNYQRKYHYDKCALLNRRVLRSSFHSFSISMIIFMNGIMTMKRFSLLTKS